MTNSTDDPRQRDTSRRLKRRVAEIGRKLFSAPGAHLDEGLHHRVEWLERELDILTDQFNVISEGRAQLTVRSLVVKDGWRRDRIVLRAEDDYAELKVMATSRSGHESAAVLAATNGGRMTDDVGAEVDILISGSGNVVDCLSAWEKMEGWESNLTLEGPTGATTIDGDGLKYESDLRPS